MAVFVVPSRVTVENFRISFETAAMLESPSLEAALVDVLERQVVMGYISGDLVARDDETFRGLMRRHPDLDSWVGAIAEEREEQRRDVWALADFEAMDEVDYMTE